MGETCPDCRRPTGTVPSADVDPVMYWRTCWDRGGNVCRAAAAGYRRGIDEGVRLAKEHAEPTIKYIGDGDYLPGDIDWTDVEAAAAEAKGEDDA